MLTLSRNLGLLGGASSMGMLFAAAGMRTAFLAALLPVGAASLIWWRTGRTAARHPA
jgi:hypothetical protein